MIDTETRRVIDELTTSALPVDIDKPGEYQNLINIARSMEAFIVAMPLDEMVERADDQCGLSYLGFNQDSSRELKRTRAALTILRFAKKELQKIRARYGE